MPAHMYTVQLSDNFPFLYKNFTITVQLNINILYFSEFVVNYYNSLSHYRGDIRISIITHAIF